MKKILTLTALILAIVFTANAQKKVKYSDIAGKQWKLTIDIGDEIEKELDDNDSFFERIVIKSVSGLVENVLDEIDIYFEFQENNRLKVSTHVFGEEESDYTSWKIVRGALVIDDSDNFKTDSDSRWYMMDDILVAVDEDEDFDDVHVYLVAVD